MPQPLIRPSNESSPIKPRPAAAAAASAAFPEKKSLSGSHSFLKTQSEPSLLLDSPRTHSGLISDESNIFDLVDNLAASNLGRSFVEFVQSFMPSISVQANSFLAFNSVRRSKNVDG